MSTNLIVPPSQPVVAISLDGVLRNVSEPFYRAYVERFGAAPEEALPLQTPVWERSAEDPDQFVARFEQEQTSEQAKPMAPLRMGVRSEEGPLDGTLETPVRPVPELAELTPFNLLEKFTFASEEETNDFVQGDGFFIFGRAPQAEYGLLTSLNQLYYGVKARGGKLVLIGSDMLKLRPSALFFISNLGACFDEIRFVASVEEFWAGVDVLVTASERLLAARPEGKQVAFRLTDYNTTPERVEAPKNTQGAALTQPVTYVRGIAQLLEYYPSHLTSFDEQD